MFHQNSLTCSDLIQISSTMQRTSPSRPGGGGGGGGGGGTGLFVTAAFGFVDTQWKDSLVVQHVTYDNWVLTGSSPSMHVTPPAARPKRKRRYSSRQ